MLRSLTTLTALVAAAVVVVVAQPPAELRASHGRTHPYSFIHHMPQSTDADVVDHFDHLWRRQPRQPMRAAFTPVVVGCFDDDDEEARSDFHQASTVSPMQFHYVERTFPGTASKNCKNMVEVHDFFATKVHRFSSVPSFVNAAKSYAPRVTEFQPHLTMGEWRAAGKQCGFVLVNDHDPVSLPRRTPAPIDDEVEDYTHSDPALDTTVTDVDAEPLHLSMTENERAHMAHHDAQWSHVHALRELVQAPQCALAFAGRARFPSAERFAAETGGDLSRLPLMMRWLDGKWTTFDQSKEMRGEEFDKFMRAQ